ncbi:hypothetical protein [Cupriavidus pauculus]|uniref:hypothetical protein n=1 Tax=Cupriavidus pauculus TaxID=82633 RepID=UPI0015DE7978|nr:hypothetical protein [Cupriavidus pauculus]
MTRWRPRARAPLSTLTRLACLLCLLPALPPLRGWLESSMAMLMPGLLPCLFAAGCLAPRLLAPRRRARALAWLRPYALALLVVASVAAGVWMLPIAIDLSRMSWQLGVVRDVSVCVAGLAGVTALRIAPWPLVLFFGGNMVWMGLTFGMLFVDAQTRLCANYLLGDQRVAGIGLIVGAIGFGTWLLAWAAWVALAGTEAAGSARQQKRLKKSCSLPIMAANDKNQSEGPA